MTHVPEPIRAASDGVKATTSGHIVRAVIARDVPHTVSAALSEQKQEL